MEDDRENSSTYDQSLIPEARLPTDSLRFPEKAPHLPQETDTDSKPPLSQTDVFRALEVVERDSVAIAQSYTSLFDSLRLALSEATRNSVDHMHCFNDAAGRLQESVLDAATKGNRYINSCLRLNEEMKGVDSLASQLTPLILMVFGKLVCVLMINQMERANKHIGQLVAKHIQEARLAIDSHMEEQEQRVPEQSSKTKEANYNQHDNQGIEAEIAGWIM